MLKLERTWWFMVLASSLAGIGTLYLLDAAGIAWPPHGMAQWLLYVCCFVTISQTVSFVARLLIVLLAPSSALAARSGTAANR